MIDPLIKLAADAAKNHGVAICTEHMGQVVIHSHYSPCGFCEAQGKLRSIMDTAHKLVSLIFPLGVR